MTAYNYAPYRTTYPGWRTDPSEAGLVAAWDMVPQGQTVYDLSPNGYHLTEVNSLCHQRGPLGDCTLFPGFGCYLARTIANFRSADTKGTIEFVFKFNDAIGARDLFCSSDAPGWNNRLEFTLYTGIGSEKTLRILQVDGGALNRVETTTKLYPGLWYHAVIVSSGTAWKIYVNGVDDALSVVSGSNNGNWFADTSARDNITIGAYAAGGGAGYYYDGLIGRVRIYSDDKQAAWVTREYAKLRGAGFAWDYGVKTTVANVAAVNQLSNSGFTVQSGTFAIVDDTISDFYKLPDNAIDPTDDSLIAGYYMNPSGTTITDVSTGGHNGTTSGSPVAGREWVGHTLSFNGTTQYMVATGVTGTSGDYTFEFWIKASAFAGHNVLCDFLTGRIQLALVSGEFKLYDGSTRFFGSTPLNDLLFHHIVLICNSSSGKSDLYCDGVHSGSQQDYTTRNLGGVFTIASAWDGTDPFSGKINSFSLYDECKDLTWIQAQYARTSPRNLRNVPVKALKCTAAGVVDIQSSTWCTDTTPAGHGRFEFWFKTALAADTIRFNISNNGAAASNTGYYFNVSSLGAAEFYEDAVCKFSSGSGYISPLTWYKCTIIARNDGTIYTYINDMMVPASTGSNPFTDLTYTYNTHTSIYLNTNCEVALSDPQGKYRLTKGVLP